MNEKNSMHDWPLRRYDFPMPIRYNLTPGSGAGLVICLHGYQDHALSMVRRMGWWQTSLPFQLLAINGPFPVPIWLQDGFKEAYSWYFRDTSRDLEFVSPQTTALRLKDLLQDLKLNETPCVLVGFSQGGFLCPYLADIQTSVRAIIGIGCGYSLDIYQRARPLQLFAIHGSKDERIPIASTRQDFSKVLQLGHHGEFHEVEGLTHRVETSIEPLVRRLVLQSLNPSGT